MGARGLSHARRSVGGTEVPSAMNVVILGCSYRTAPVGVRERLAFTDEQAGRALDRLSATRVGAETCISRGDGSVPSAAVDYVREVVDDFGDKTVLVIGTGKMGELTLKHLRELQPNRILVTNRSPAKARQVADGCKG